MNQPALAPAPHPSMQSTDQDDQVLHDQLLAVQGHLPDRHPGGAGLQHHHMAPNTASPRHQPNIDPAISGAAMMGAVAPQTPTQPQHQQGSPDDGSKGAGGKRELSTSKRAAQNRAAQRAFRQRKETYIRKLEDEIKLVDSYKENLNKLNEDNYHLRNYIMTLHQRMVEAHIEIPPIPTNVDLNQQPRHDLGLTMGGGGSIQQQPQQPDSVGGDLNSLNSIAVAGLGVRGRGDESNFMGNNFQADKPQRSDDGTTDPDLVAKQEPQHPHGLPMA